MDPASLSASFATVVGLLSDYVAHREARQNKSFDGFMVWLSDMRHDELRTMLEKNSSAAIGLKALLNDNHQQVMHRLQTLDRVLASVAGQFDLYRGIAEATHPAATLSPAAVSLLTEIHDSGASKILMVQYLSEGVRLHVVDGPGGEIQITEPRFLKDDLASLVELGFLDTDRNARGETIFILRRAGARFVEINRAG